MKNIVLNKENCIDIIIKHAADEACFSIQKDMSQISIQHINGSNKGTAFIDISEDVLISIRDSINNILDAN